jgi:nitroreductase
MDTFDAIYARRSVKHFDPEHEMPEADLTKLLEAAIQAPTELQHPALALRGRQDPELAQQIRANGNDQAQMTDASC